MICRKFSELNPEQQNQIASYLFDKKHHLIKDIMERKIDDLKISISNPNEIAEELAYVNSKYYIIDILIECDWAVFDEDFKMYIFETRCK